MSGEKILQKVEEFSAQGLKSTIQNCIVWVEVLKKEQKGKLEKTTALMKLGRF